MVRQMGMVCTVAVLVLGQDKDYSEDSLIVREILDLNRLDTVTVESVTDTSQGRITALALRRSSIWYLPGSICSLTALTTLDLYGNVLGDDLPGSIGRLSNLTYLDLSDCGLMGLPDEIWDLTNLRHLNLATNSIGEFMENGSLPTGLGNLTELEYLNLATSALTGLPDEVVLLAKIDTLDLAVNRLCSLASEIQEWADTYDPDWRDTQDCTPIAWRTRPTHSHKPLMGTTPVILYNLHGKLVGSMRFGEVSQCLEGVPRGTYLVVGEAGGNGLRKIVVGR